MSDQTWTKAILAIYWLLWDGHSALIEIFINNSHPGHLGCALPICPCRGNAALESYLTLWWKYQITTTDHDHDKRRGMGEGSSFDFLFEIWASTQNRKKYWKLRNIFMILQEQQRPCWSLVLVSDCHGQELRKNARSLAAAQWGDQNWD